MSDLTHPFSDSLAAGIWQGLLLIPEAQRRDVKVCALEHSTDKHEPRANAAIVSANTATHLQMTASRDDAITVARAPWHFDFPHLVALCDPITDPQRADFWRRYASEKLQIWDTNEPAEDVAFDDVVDLEIYFVAALIRASSDIRKRARSEWGVTLEVALYAEELEISALERNQQANDNQLAPEAVRYWQDISVPEH